MRHSDEQGRCPAGKYPQGCQYECLPGQRFYKGVLRFSDEAEPHGRDSGIYPLSGRQKERFTEGG